MRVILLTLLFVALSRPAAAAPPAATPGSPISSFSVPSHLRPRMTLPSDTSSLPLSAAHSAQRRAWLDRVAGRSFAERAKGQPWEAEGLSFIAAAFDHWEPLSIYENDADLAERAAHLRYASKCQDPLIHCLLGRLQVRASFDGFHDSTSNLDFDGLYRATLPEATARIERSLQELDTLGTPAGFLRLVALEAALYCGWTNEIPRQEDLWQKAARWFQVSLSDHSYRLPGPDEDLLVEHTLSEPAWRNISRWRDDYRPAVEDAPLSNWAREALLGACELAELFRTRGANNMTDVSPALPRFAEAWKLHPSSPEAAEMVYSYSWRWNTPDGASQQEWFERVLAARFDYLPPYRETLHWIHPGWSDGRPGEEIALARACVATHRFDTQIPLLLLHALKTNVGIDGWLNITRTPENGRALVELGRGMLAEPSRRSQAHLWRSLAAVWAWLGGMDQEAVDDLARLPGGKLHPMALQELHYFQTTPEQMKGELAVRLSPARDTYLNGEAFYDGEKTAEARDAFTAALELVGDRPDGITWLKNRRAIADFEEKSRAGEWMPAPLDLSFWQVVVGTWSNSPEGALVLEGKPGTAFARFQPRMGGDWEIRGEYSFSVPSGDHARPELGIAFRCAGTESFLQCTTWPEEGPEPKLAVTLRSGVWTPRLGGAVTELPGDARAPLRDRNRFYLKMGYRHCTLELNDVKVWDNSFLKLYNGLGDKSRIGFAAKEPGPGNLITIHSLEVRRLPSSRNDP